jgi:hypothetical protein
MVNVCKICGKTFTERGLHGHVIKAHNIAIPEYYERHYPKVDRLTGEKIPYIDYHSYIDAQFQTRANEREWLKRASKEEAKEYLLKVLRQRVELKKLTHAPSFVEFETSELPPYKAYVYFFGSYEAACKEIGLTPLLRDRREVPVIAPKEVELLIDTREQRPLKFKKSKQQKLAFGDYTLSGDDYSYTYVDRKSDSDFKNTVTIHQERFLRELQRAVDMDSYVYVVVEESIANIELYNKMAAHAWNLNYVWSSMRKIQHLYPRRCQFVFTGSRENSQKIIPYLLRYGKELWDTDVQYLLTVKGAV